MTEVSWLTACDGRPHDWKKIGPYTAHCRRCGMEVVRRESEELR